jgi:N-acyl-D-amino-acid deacylase
MPYEVVIRNGTVVDGSGSAPYRADVAIRDGRIAEIGHITDQADEVIDAEGHVVTPGFIDGHTHMDAQVMWDPLGTCSCWHGVTTVVMGNCGFTLAPARAEERALVVRNLERAEDISPAALAAGVDWQWETFPEFLDALDRLPMGINYSAQIGHSALRTWAMGERAFEEEASDTDVDAMISELSDGLRAGAIGFTTTRSAAHETSDNRPVASRLASWAEVRRLVGSMTAHGRRIFEITPATKFASPEGWDEEYDRICDLALESRIPVTYGLFGTRAQRERTLAKMGDVVAAGGEMFAQTHSRGITSVLSLQSRLPFDVLPEWQEMRSRPLADQLAALRDPSTRARLLDAANNGHYGDPIGAEPRKPAYDQMTVLQHPIPPNPTIGQLASQRNMDPAEVMIDLIVESNGDRFFVQPLGLVDDVLLVDSMKHPLTVMTFSDSGAHVSQIMDSSIQTHLLAYWVRERQKFTLQEAVRMVTSTPATLWGFGGRGLLSKGSIADINIFDPDTVGPELPTVAHDLPGGAMRLKQKATGFLATLVGGKTLFRDGEHTGALPGRLLRAGQNGEQR